MGLPVFRPGPVLSTARKIACAMDPVNERFTNYPPANDLLHYEYRQPWTL